MRSGERAFAGMPARSTHRYRKAAQQGHAGARQALANLLEISPDGNQPIGEYSEYPGR